MKWMNEWFSKSKQVIFNPSGFFEEVERKGTYKYSVKFAVTSLLIMSFLTIPIELLSSTSVALSNIGYMLLIAAISGIFGGSIGIMINSGITHIFVYLLGGKEYVRTLEVYSYSTSINAFLGWIPFVSLGASIYGIYIQIKGIEEYHDFTTSRAAVSVLVPVLLTFILVVGIAFFLWSQSIVQTSMPGTTPALAG